MLTSFEGVSLVQGLTDLISFRAISLYQNKTTSDRSTHKD
jgi:hypothetical protein